MATRGKWQSWDLKPGTRLWMLCSEIPPLCRGTCWGRGISLVSGDNGSLFFLTRPEFVYLGEQVAAPNKGDAGGDNPIIPGLPGLLGGQGLNPACFGAGLRETARAWPPAVCCKTMSQPGWEGSGKVGGWG